MPSSTASSTMHTGFSLMATVCARRHRKSPLLDDLIAGGLVQNPSWFRYVTLRSEPMPPKAFGDRPLTNAERRARHRAARAASRPGIHSQPVTGRRSRARRWRDAVAELVILQSEYAQCA